MVVALATTWFARVRSSLTRGGHLPRMPRLSVPALRWTIAGGALAPLLITLGVVFAGTPGQQARALAPIEVRGALATAVPTVAAEPKAEPVAIEAGDDAVAEAADEPEDESAGVDRQRARTIATANKLVAKGHRLRKAGRLGLAEDAYMSALKALPSYPRAMAGLVRVHLQRRASVEAVRWAKKLVERQPRSGQNQLLLGDAHQLMGAKAEAQKAWRQAARYGNRIARKRLDR